MLWRNLLIKYHSYDYACYFIQESDENDSGEESYDFETLAIKAEERSRDHGNCFDKMVQYL